MNLHDEYFNSILKKNDNIVVGLSGGADSVCLTHILKFSSENFNFNVYACHINHNLRGEESLRDLKFVEKLCKKWGIPLFVKDVDINKIAQEQKISVEECGRKIRYDFFDEIACNLNAKIATAHTLSDNAETLIFNLTRGAGLQGLCGIPKARQNIVRPIINLTRSDIEDYCKQNNLEYITDSTNAQTIYTRNKIRHEIIPVLKQINPSVEKTIANTINSLNVDNDYLLQTANNLYDKAKIEDQLCINLIKNEHNCIRSRIAIRFLNENNLSVSNKNINFILDIVDSKISKFNISKNCFIENVHGNLCVTSQQNLQDYFEIPLKDGFFESKTEINYKIKTLEENFSEKFNNSTKNIFEFFIDCGKICGSIIIRQRKSGDFIKLSNSKHTKSLKKIFNEKNIPIATRKKLFVIADDNGVIAVESLGIDKKFICDKNTTKFIHIANTQNK